MLDLPGLGAATAPDPYPVFDRAKIALVAAGSLSAAIALAILGAVIERLVRQLRTGWAEGMPLGPPVAGRLLLAGPPPSAAGADQVQGESGHDDGQADQRQPEVEATGLREHGGRVGGRGRGGRGVEPGFALGAVQDLRTLSQLVNQRRCGWCIC